MTAEQRQPWVTVSDADDAAAFDAELRPLLEPALRLAAAMHLNSADAEDAVQEAALRAWDKRSRRRPGTPLRPWFLTIVANQCRDTRRHRWASVLRFAEPPPGAASREADTAADLDLVSALRALTYDVALATVLRYYLDLPFDEVAAVSGCSVDAAKSRVRRGLAALATALRLPEDLR